MMKKWIGMFAVGALGAAAGVTVATRLQPAPQETIKVIHEAGAPAQAASFPAPMASGKTVSALPPDFVQASAMAKPAVVHIKSYYEEAANDAFSRRFGSRPSASGSGVIISEDGFITTNYHVIRNADKVEVILEDKRSYIAKVIGTDPTTDLALLEIEADGLAYLEFGNSDQVQIGEWVLAVGNPFNLTSTVTAGIVSAKGRSLNLLNEEFAIESFIQTDAVVNPGNSGGALIDPQGQLVGINTAIASETGSYAGYSFAVPVNIVRKVMRDLKEFGEVQRGIIGVQIRNINSQFAAEQGLAILNGAYVNGTIEGGAAEAAGIQRGDVITQVNGVGVSSASELQEAIGTYRPGDKVRLRIIRDNEEQMLEVTLRDREGKTMLSARRGEAATDDEVPSLPWFEKAETLGAHLEQLTFKEKTDLGLEAGVRVSELGEGKLREAGVEEGFVIVRVNKEYVTTPADVEKLVQKTDGSILLEGYSPSGKRKFYAFEN